MSITSTHTARRTTALLAATAALPLAAGLLVAPAQAAGHPARITASVTDSTPASGQEFRVSGRLTRDGDPVSGRTVKVQTLRAGAWENLTGAQMSTSGTGSYNLRVILGQTGERTLRVVGKVPGRNPHKRFVVTVH